MPERSAKFALAFLSLAIASSAQARSVTLSQCLKITEKMSSQSAIAALKEESARFGAAEAKSQTLPQLSYEGLYQKSGTPFIQNNIDQNYSFLNIQQTLSPFSSPWYTAKQKEVEFQAAKLSKAQATQDISLLIKNLYFQALADGDSENGIGNFESRLKKLQKMVIPRFVVGRTIAFDLVKVKTAITDIQRRQAILQADRLGIEEELSQILGLGHSHDIDPVAPANFPDLPSFDEAGHDIEDNPGLKALEKQSQALTFAIKAEKSARLPTPVADLQYGNGGISPNEMPLGWNVGVALNLPLYDWGYISSRVSKAQSNLLISQTSALIMKQTLWTELARDFALARSHRADRERMLALLPETEKASKETMRQYRHGAIGIMEATDAFNLWLTTFFEERQAYYAYLSDLARIQSITGGKIKVDYGI